MRFCNEGNVRSRDPVFLFDVVGEPLLSERVGGWLRPEISLLCSTMGSVSEDAQDLIFHHCHFPTSTRRDSESLHNNCPYGSISVFEPNAILPDLLSKIEATRDLLHAAWASLLCNYTRNEIVAFVTNTGNQTTSHTSSRTNGRCSVQATGAWLVEYQALNKDNPGEIHRVSLERCSPRALRDAQVNTAIDFHGALSINNGRETGRLSQLLENQHIDFAEIVSPFSIDLRRNSPRLRCIGRTASYASAHIFYPVEPTTKAKRMNHGHHLCCGNAYVLSAYDSARLDPLLSPAPNLLFI